MKKYSACVVVLFSCSSLAPIQAQNPDMLAPTWPKHCVAFGAGIFMQAGLQAFQEYGAQRDFRSRYGVAEGLQLEYAFRTKKGHLFGFQAATYYTQLGFTANVEISNNPLGGTVRVGRNARPKATGFLQIDHPEFMVSFGHVIHKRKRLCITGEAQVGMIPLWSSWLVKGSYFHGPSDSLQSVALFALVDEGLDIFPIVGGRLQLQAQAKNFNRWSLALEGKFTPSSYYEGLYQIYQGAPYEGGGQLRGRLAYFGLRVGYGVTWGKPRIPRWMRKRNERDEYLHQRRIQ